MKTIEVKTSKNLKALGVKKESHALWRHRVGYDEDNIGSIIIRDCVDEHYLASNENILFPAYTLDEILEMLSFSIFKNGKEYLLYILKAIPRHSNSPHSYIIGYGIKTDNCNNLFIAHDTNPAEAAGQLLIWCIENGHVKCD